MHIPTKTILAILLLSIVPLQSMQLYKVIAHRLQKTAIALLPASALVHNYRTRTACAQEQSNTQTTFCTKRPEKVQEAVDRAFEASQSTMSGTWLYDGSPWYTLLGIDEEVLVNKLVASGKKDIYMIDVGCGQGDWGRNIKSLLDTYYKNSKTKFHIFSITGGKECQEEVIKSGNVTLYQLN